MTKPTRVRFHGPRITRLEVELTALRAEPDAPVEATVELTPDQWGLVDRLDTFHLEPAHRGPGSVSEGSPVRVDLRLADELVAELVGADDPREELARRSTGNRDDPLLSTESWYALRVTEEQEVPEELAGPGVELRTGFQTRWVDGLDAGDGSTGGAGATPSTMREVVRAVLDEHQFQATDEGDVFEVEGHGANGEWTLRVVLLEDEDRVMILSVWPEEIPPDRRAAVMEVITRLNARTVMGAFVLDLDQGDLGFRCAIDTGGDQLRGGMFREVLAVNLQTMDDVFPALQAAVDGESVESALAAVEDE